MCTRELRRGLVECCVTSERFSAAGPAAENRNNGPRVSRWLTVMPEQACCSAPALSGVAGTGSFGSPGRSSVPRRVADVPGKYEVSHGVAARWSKLHRRALPVEPRTRIDALIRSQEQNVSRRRCDDRIARPISFRRRTGWFPTRIGAERAKILHGRER
jgi:hypothetical protein